MTDERLRNPITTVNLLPLDKVLAIAEAGLDLAQYASYAEIVGALAVNRQQVRKSCDDLFRLHGELDNELDAADAPMFSETDGLWDNAIARFRSFSAPAPTGQMIGPTRGPWKIYQDGIHPVLDDGSSVNDGYAICQFFGPDGFANAQLTMAAPDLLDATREAIRFFEGSGTPQTCLAQLRAAYKKAGGLAHVDR